MTEWPQQRRPGYGEPEPGPVTLTVVIPSEEVQNLERQAREDGISVTEAIQRSLVIGHLVWIASRSGGRAFIQETDGSVREIEMSSRNPDAKRRRMK